MPESPSGDIGAAGSGKEAVQNGCSEERLWTDVVAGKSDDLSAEIVKMRYAHILSQIKTVDDNVLRFLTIYQTVVSALVAGQVLLFVNHNRWALTAEITKIGLRGIFALEIIVGAFACLMIIIGMVAWLDYRKEECQIANALLGDGFRDSPDPSHWYRWHETYVVLFILLSLIAISILVEGWMIPAV
jgi:hypothetical protein